MNMVNMITESMTIHTHITMNKALSIIHMGRITNTGMIICIPMTIPTLIKTMSIVTMTTRMIMHIPAIQS